RPPAGALAAAGALLRELGALDQAGRITADGRRMAQLGAHPRLAAMLLAADGAAEQAMAADLAALLEERDPLRSPEAPCDIALRLAATAADWLAPHLLGYVKLADLQRLDLLALLRGALPWPLPATLDQALPTHLSLPGGRAAIDYTQPVPQAEARAQAFYGVTETPRLAGGRVPLRLALLSPAGRPVAVTADLAQFWTGGWADVRRDMRGRYPKHRWPENPARPEEG
ncbi:MAG: ATP-dependent helicase HrpB, partial [Rhodospirillales bacterium]|nr:ATP-dependent helicase HrpB [Rhodospirillales bacterium]